MEKPPAPVAVVDDPERIKCAYVYEGKGCQFTLQACKLVGFDGEAYCPFHLEFARKTSWDEAKRETFNRAIFDLIEDANQKNRIADFTGVVFPAPISFEHFTAERPLPAIKFTEATFSGDAWFRNATFGGVARFQNAIFDGVAVFENAIFSADARFENATFSGVAWFRNATFSSDARFQNARFGGVAWFPNAAFRGDARFQSATFGDAWFQDATFGDADFSCSPGTSKAYSGTSRSRTRSSMGEPSSRTANSRNLPVSAVATSEWLRSSTAALSIRALRSSGENF